MQRKKILIVIDWFLPGTKSGGPVRSYANMIEHLREYHDFYVITRDTDYCSDEVYDNIQSNAWNQLNDHMFVYYFSKDKLNKRNLKNLLKKTAFDIAYINGIYSWYFSIVPLWLLRKHKNVIVAARGMLNPQAFSVKGRKKKMFLDIAKLLGIYKNVRFHATNDNEANHIRQMIGSKSKVLIAPNLPRITPLDTEFAKNKQQPTRFVNIARVSVEKGTLKMIEALHEVTQQMTLDFYGPIYDQNYWSLCKKSIERLPNHIKVSYKGVLPSEDVPDVLRQYDFFVLLSEGENFGHAILEAFMAGLPVIISNQTPWKDLEKRKVGWDIEADDLSNVASTLTRAIQMSNDKYTKHSNNAKKYATQFSENPELLMLNLNLFNF